MEINIASKLSAEEILEKIKQKVDNRGFVFDSIFGSQPFIGSFNGTKFKMYKRIYYGNSFIPVFYGEILSLPGGSEIRGKFHMLLPVRIFMTVWFTGVGIGCISGLVAFFNHSVQVNNFKFLFISFLMIAAGVILVKSGQWFCRGHYAAVKGYLQACAGHTEIHPETYRIKPIFQENYWPVEFLVRRILAFLWDSVLPGSPFIFLQATQNYKMTSDTFAWLAMLSFFIYESLALILWGKGLGKKMAQLEVVSKNGGRLQPWKAILRVGIKVICLMPAYMYLAHGYGLLISASLFLIPFIFTKESCFIHDLLTDTRVVLQGSIKK